MESWSNRPFLSKIWDQVDLYSTSGEARQEGMWERTIRSIRKILRSLLGGQTVNNETLLTLIAEVKTTLNDRPFTPPKSDSNDPEHLTPSKLLLLRPNVCFGPGDPSDADISKNKR